MKFAKNTIAVIIFAAFASSSMATDKKPVKTPSPQTSVPAANATANAVGVGIAASRSTIKSNINNTVRASGGAGGSSTVNVGNGSVPLAVGGAVDFAGARVGGDSNVTFERSVPSAMAPGASVPSKSCRLTIGLGGSGSAASGSGGFPIGNDQTCLSGVAIEFLDALRTRGINVDQADYTRAACKVEGMADTSPCKAQAEEDRMRQSSAASVSPSYAVASSAVTCATATDEIVRERLCRKGQ